MRTAHFLHQLFCYAIDILLLLADFKEKNVHFYNLLYVEKSQPRFLCCKNKLYFVKSRNLFLVNFSVYWNIFSLGHKF